MRTPEVHCFRAFGGARCQIIASSARIDELSAAIAEVYAFESRLTRFDAASELSRFNHSSGSTVPVSPLLEALLRVALDAYSLSEGLVNAAVLPALIAAGYDRSIEEVRRRDGHRPAPEAAVSSPALTAVLDVDRGRATLARGCAIDLGGVGKGWLADRLCERLGDAVVSLGGDLRAIGSGPDGEGWCVGLCDGAAVLVRDAGVATSGTSGRRWKGGHHLLDPRTGRPADTDVSAVTVVAGSALDAEVLSKMAAIAGSVDGPQLARSRGALRVAVVGENASGSAA